MLNSMYRHYLRGSGYGQLSFDLSLRRAQADSPESLIVKYVQVLSER